MKSIFATVVTAGLVVLMGLPASATAIAPVSDTFNPISTEIAATYVCPACGTVVTKPSKQIELPADLTASIPGKPDEWMPPAHNQTVLTAEVVQCPCCGAVMTKS